MYNPNPRPPDGDECPHEWDTVSIQDRTPRGNYGPDVLEPPEREGRVCALCGAVEGE